jgi:hypothetical protein
LADHLHDAEGGRCGEYEIIASAVDQTSVAKRADDGLRVVIFDLPPQVCDRPNRQETTGIGQQVEHVAFQRPNAG